MTYLKYSNLKLRFFSNFITSFKQNINIEDQIWSDSTDLNINTYTNTHTHTHTTTHKKIADTQTHTLTHTVHTYTEKNADTHTNTHMRHTNTYICIISQGIS